MGWITFWHLIAFVFLERRFGPWYSSGTGTLCETLSAPQFPWGRTYACSCSLFATEKTLFDSDCDSCLPRDSILLSWSQQVYVGASISDSSLACLRAQLHVSSGGSGFCPSNYAVLLSCRVCWQNVLGTNFISFSLAPATFRPPYLLFGLSTAP